MTKSVFELHINVTKKFCPNNNLNSSTSLPAALTQWILFIHTYNSTALRMYRIQIGAAAGNVIHLCGTSFSDLPILQWHRFQEESLLSPLLKVSDLQHKHTLCLQPDHHLISNWGSPDKVSMQGSIFRVPLNTMDNTVQWLHYLANI